MTESEVGEGAAEAVCATTAGMMGETAMGGGGEAVGATGEGMREEEAEAGEAATGVISDGATIWGTAGVGTRFGKEAASTVVIWQLGDKVEERKGIERIISIFGLLKHMVNKTEA